MSKLFNLAVQALAVPGIADTQCGFKGFTARAAQDDLQRRQRAIDLGLTWRRCISRGRTDSGSTSCP